MSYGEFLEAKRLTVPSVGFDVDLSALNSHLFPWQARLTQWALRRGRAALWEDCGLGKGLQALEWGRKVAEHTGLPVLMLAPLGVTKQLEHEMMKFGVSGVRRVRDQSEIQSGVNITNYERLHRFGPEGLGGIVCDESGCLKGNGPLRKGLTEFAEPIPYRLACTATPAPNDTTELINHAEFLGIMKGTEILALFFRQDGNTTHNWRLKGHGEAAFYRWLSSWAVAMRRPSDIGGDDAGFLLPAINFHEHNVETCLTTHTLFSVDARGIQEQRQARRDTLAERVKRAADLANSNDEQWLVWCDLNAESEALTKSIPGAVEVTGSDTPDHKETAMMGFAEGRVRVLVSKPDIAGFGMNFQRCHNMAFVGLGNSYEKYYQSLRRCWRFGQTQDVHAHVIVSEADGAVVRNIERKERAHNVMMGELVKAMGNLELAIGSDREEMDYQTAAEHGQAWKLLLGDCVERIREVQSESVGLSIFSPPFPSMYAYTNSARDMGNAQTFSEMIEHFTYLMQDLLRVTMPGRSCCMHLTQALAFLGKDGYIGMKDFRGETIKAMEAAGWIYYSEVTIDKDPQLKAIRTKDRGLLFKTLASDAAHMRMAMADYLLHFRKPGDNPEPIRAGISAKYGNNDGWITQEEWIRWARPVWYAADWAPDGDGIRESEVLSVHHARDDEDEKHLCPLQLGVIRRAVRLWTNPGDLVLSPFAGIGSEGYVSIQQGRRFVGIELKPTYYRTAARNLKAAETLAGQKTLSLFDEVAA